MSWVRQHCDSTSVLVVARVAKEEGRYSVRLFAGGVIPQPGTNSYPTRETAFEVGDTLVRVKFPHDCGWACSGWTEDADVR
jgi:hypothetical protein